MSALLHLRGFGLCIFVTGLLAIPSSFAVSPVATSVNSTASAIDFKFSPPIWDTLISMPDDWQKTLINQEGSVLYDYPGPYENSKTVVTFGEAKTKLKVKKQSLESPRVPIVITQQSGPGINLRQDAFSIVSQPNLPRDPHAPEAKIRRLDRLTGNVEWANPIEKTDPAFSDVAIGFDRPIHYVVNVEKFGHRKIALGFCEGYWSEKGKRVLDLVVEGAATQTIDPIALGPKNQAHVLFFDAKDLDGNGQIDIYVMSNAISPDRNTILNVIWSFSSDIALSADEVISGRANPKADAYIACGQDLDRDFHAARVDAILAQYEGDAQPTIEIKTTRTVVYDSGNGILSLKGSPFLSVKPSAPKATKTSTGIVLTFAKGTKKIEAIMIKGHLLPTGITTVPDLAAERARSIDYWTKLAMPWNKIHVPDAGIQALLDSSVRNIYQARELKGGQPEYRVGPTEYRDIFVADGAFLLEVAASLGDVTESRRAIEHVLDYQTPSGQIVVLFPSYLKETGLMLWTMYRHATLTQDSAWLASKWSKIQAAVNWIKETRKLASVDPKAPYYGLMPPGISDGGIWGPSAEYTNVYWNLSGLKAAIDAAKWLGKSDEVESWTSEYENFKAAFEKAAARDLKTDRFGNRFLPIQMGFDEEKELPQKAQWAFCHAIFPGKIFAANDPIATGTLAMLDSLNVEGLVLSTGWLTDGLWNYFGSFYAHAHLWQGNIFKAQQTLYAFGNHASPLLTWREEQMPHGKGDKFIGDMPHNWASAEFIRLVRHFIALERGNELELLGAVPDSWYVPGDHIEINGMATEFGQLKLKVAMSADGNTVQIDAEPLGVAGMTGGPYINLAALKRLGFVSNRGEVLPEKYLARWAQPLKLTLVRPKN